MLLTRARHDTRAWAVKRRERTRQLIELGGLVAKANLVELTEDDRAVLLGLMIEAAATLRGERREQAIALWRRRGKRAFEESAADKNGGSCGNLAPHFRSLSKSTADPESRRAADIGQPTRRGRNALTRSQ